jgi:ABC-type transporter Mla subunit MlaD
VPGPSDVIAAVEGVRDGVAEALALVPRIAAAVGRMEHLLDRVDGVVTRVEGVVDRADDAIAAVAVTRERADDVIAGVEATQAKADTAINAVSAIQAAADAAIEAVGRTTTRADEALTRADGLIGRLEPLLEAYQQPLADLAPSVRRLATTLDPAEVEALVTLIDRLPRLVSHLDEDILPVLESLGGVGPDVHDLLDTVQDLRQVVKGFPGSRLFRRRGAEEIAEEESRERPES